MKMIKMMIIVTMAMMMRTAMGNIVDKTCKETPLTTLFVSLSLLNSDPRSSSADIVGLGLILVDKIKLHRVITEPVGD
ncbi:unnamed protein product [Brassica oleracea var. botrytis]|uniref:(rape) hypothetical protein n=1 Tax=Brassica napus TaxID=3708 RepID=A0A816I993_BRANA|nr:unnamed protein product [Brassica napus]